MLRQFRVLHRLLKNTCYGVVRVSALHSKINTSWVDWPRGSLVTIAGPQEWYYDNKWVFPDFVPTRSSSRVFWRRAFYVWPILLLYRVLQALNLKSGPSGCLGWPFESKDCLCCVLLIDSTAMIRLSGQSYLTRVEVLPLSFINKGVYMGWRLSMSACRYRPDTEAFSRSMEIINVASLVL